MPLRERRARNATLYNPPTPGQPTTSASPHARRTRCAHTAHTLHIYATEFAQMLQVLNTGLSCAQSPPIPDGINSQHCPCCQPRNSFEDHGAETSNIAQSMRTSMNDDLLTHMMLIIIGLDMQNRKGPPTRVH